MEASLFLSIIMVSTLASYSGDPGFDSWSQVRPSSQRVFVAKHFGLIT
jgi:hypothetical protein